MEPGQLEHELCGLLSVQRFSFLSNIIIEFTSDDEEFFTGFYAQVYTMSKYMIFYYFFTVRA